MNRKMILSLLVLAVLAALAAGCSGIQLPWAKGNTQSQQNPADFSAQPVENKLAVGILKLEGTNNAVTAEEAQKLLPLWKAVRGLANDTKTTTEEMTGLYKQIMTAMTPEQVKVIQDMTLAQGDMQEIMQKYGMPLRSGGAAPGGAQRTPQAGSRTTRQGNRSFQGGQGFQGGPGGGFPPGFMPGNGQSSGRQNSGAQSTPQAGAQRTGFRGGLNFMLADAVIRLLEQRAGS